jgi:hypothetical protein
MKKTIGIILMALLSFGILYAGGSKEAPAQKGVEPIKGTSKNF